MTKHRFAEQYCMIHWHHQQESRQPTYRVFKRARLPQAINIAASWHEFFLNSSHDDAILIVWGSHLSSPRAGLLASGHAILGLLLARVAMATCLSESVSVCMSVCLPQVGVLPKRLNESGLLWYGSFLPPILHCVKRKFGYLQNEGTFPRTPDLDNFASVYRSSKRVTDLARRLG